MSESTRTRDCLKRFRACNPGAFALKINLRGTGGIPDAIFCDNGNTIWVEFKVCKATAKAINKALTQLQRVKISELKTAGAQVYIGVFNGRLETLYRVVGGLDCDLTIDLSLVDCGPKGHIANLMGGLLAR